METVIPGLKRYFLPLFPGGNLFLNHTGMLVSSTNMKGSKLSRKGPAGGANPSHKMQNMIISGFFGSSISG